MHWRTPPRAGGHASPGGVPRPGEPRFANAAKDVEMEEQRSGWIGAPFVGLGRLPAGRTGGRQQGQRRRADGQAELVGPTNLLYQHQLPRFD